MSQRFEKNCLHLFGPSSIPTLQGFNKAAITKCQSMNRQIKALTVYACFLFAAYLYFLLEKRKNFGFADKT